MSFIQIGKNKSIDTDDLTQKQYSEYCKRREVIGGDSVNFAIECLNRNCRENCWSDKAYQIKGIKSY